MNRAFLNLLSYSFISDSPLMYHLNSFGSYISYHIVTNSNIPGYVYGETNTCRRYSDFTWLSTELSRVCAGQCQIFSEMSIMIVYAYLFKSSVRDVQMDFAFWRWTCQKEQQLRHVEVGQHLDSHFFYAHLKWFFSRWFVNKWCTERRLLEFRRPDLLRIICTTR
jgi:hypothetical protein